MIIIIIMNKPRISEAFVQDIYHTLRFAKSEISFKISTFGGSWFWGDRYFRDLLTPVTFYHFFRGVVNFGTLRQSVIFLKRSDSSVSQLYRALSTEFRWALNSFPSGKTFRHSKTLKLQDKRSLRTGQKSTLHAAFSLLWRYAKSMRTTHISVVTV